MVRWVAIVCCYALCLILLSFVFDDVLASYIWSTPANTLSERSTVHPRFLRKLCCSGEFEFGFTAKLKKMGNKKCINCKRLSWIGRHNKHFKTWILPVSAVSLPLVVVTWTGGSNTQLAARCSVSCSKKPDDDGMFLFVWEPPIVSPFEVRNWASTQQPTDREKQSRTTA